MFYCSDFPPMMDYSLKVEVTFYHSKGKETRTVYSGELPNLSKIGNKGTQRDFQQVCVLCYLYLTEPLQQPG